MRGWRHPTPATERAGAKRIVIGGRQPGALWAWIFALGVALQAGPARADEEAVRWLERMPAAFREHSYRGTLLYAHGDHMRTLRVLHDVEGSREREKVVELEGSMREVLRVGDMVTCRLPEEGSGKSDYCPHTGPFSRALFDDVGRLQQSYRITMAGQDRVAGRESLSVAITPRDEHRYGYELWLDRESAMLLRCLLRDRHGKVLERFQFTELELDAEIPDSEFQLGDGDVTHHHLDTGGKMVAADTNGHWKLGWMPPGFEAVHELPAHAVRSGARLYTDGLARVSVFVERLEEPVKGETSHMGATVAVSRVAAHGGSDWLVTVVGEVPEPTASRMVDSVTISGD